MEPPSFTLRQWLSGAAVVALLIAASFASSATSPFINFDDPLYVLEREGVHAPGWAGFLSLWNPQNAEDGLFIEYFPLRDSMYWLTWQIFGENSTAFHLVNLAFHFLTSLLVVALGQQLKLSTSASWTAGAVFAVHPGHLESVVWIAGLKDPMYTSFLLAAVLCYARSLRLKRGASGGALVFLVLSLLCKSMGFIAPVLLLLVERFTASPVTRRELAFRLLMPSLICGLFLLHFIWVGQVNGVVLPPHGGSWPNHLMAALWAFTRYIQQAIAPYDFEFNRCFLFPQGWWDLRCPVAVSVALFFVFLLVYLRNHRLPFFLLGWFLVCLFPVMNIIPFPALVADRYLYAPSIALCLALGALSEGLERRRKAVAVVVVVVTLCLVSAARGSLWHSELALWQSTIDDEACVDSGSHLNVGSALAKREPRAALESYHRGMNSADFGDLAPAVQCDAHAAAAQAALEVGELALAIRHIERATSLCPHEGRMWQAASTVYATVNDEARDLEAAGRAAALSSGNQYLGLIWNRGLARFGGGRIDAAAADFTVCIQANPARFCSLLSAWQRQAPDHAGASERVMGLIGDSCRPRP